jgi:hypothetical protein
LLFSLFQLFDKGLDIGVGLLIRNQSPIIQIAVYHQAGHSGQVFQSLRHAVAVIGIVGAGFGIMVYDAVDFEKLNHFFYVFFL